MAQTMNLSIKGLHTHASPLSGVPQGALSVADEINISRFNIAEPRRGFDILEHALPSLNDRGIKYIFYDGELFVIYDNTFAIYDSNSGLVSRGSITKPTAAQSVRSKSINQNLYLTSSTGLLKMDDTADNLYSAGIPKGVMLEQNGALVTSGTAITVNYGTVAYRYIIGRKDNNKQTVYGGVSSRLVVFNDSTNDVNVPLKVYLPSGLDTSYFVQVYRTVTFAGTSGNPATPNDEMQMVWEQLLDNTIITNGYFTFTDIQPEELLAASLYTSPSQEGIGGDNQIPPVASDIEVYKNVLFYADVKSQHKYSFTLVSCGGLGLAVNDTITISDGVTTEVYTAKAAESVGSKHFKVDTASASLATRIDVTIKSLANIINQGSSKFYAYILSTGSSSDLPGKILIEERTQGGNAFTVVSSREAAFTPNLKATADVNQTSTNDEFKNGLRFSKAGQPEAVPSRNIFFVGSADDRIKRIVALQDGLFIFKEKDGVYVLRGENENTFTILPLDLTAKVVAPDSLVAVNNLIFGLFDAGVGAVSDSGVEYISEPIKDKIQYLLASNLDNVKELSFGISYNVDGKYILALPSTTGDTSCTQQYVFDVFGNTWCRWKLDILAGGVNPLNEKLYLSPGDTNEIKIERKNFDATDFADYKTLREIVSYSGTTVIVDDASDIEVGDVLEQGSLLAYVEAVNINTAEVTIDIEQAWTTGVQTVTHLKAIKSVIQWNNQFADNPAGLKLFYETNLLFKQAFLGTAYVYYYSDVNPSESSVAISATGGSGAFGDFVFGELPFGGDSVAEPVRLGVPTQHKRCNLLTVRFESGVCFSDFQLNGLSLTFNPTSTRTTRN